MQVHKIICIVFFICLLTACDKITKVTSTISSSVCGEYPVIKHRESNSETLKKQIATVECFLESQTIDKFNKTFSRKYIAELDDRFKKWKQKYNKENVSFLRDKLSALHGLHILGKIENNYTELSAYDWNSVLNNAGLIHCLSPVRISSDGIQTIDFKVTNIKSTGCPTKVPHYSDTDIGIERVLVFNNIIVLVGGYASATQIVNTTIFLDANMQSFQTASAIELFSVIKAADKEGFILEENVFLEGDHYREPSKKKVITFQSDNNRLIANDVKLEKTGWFEGREDRINKRKADSIKFEKKIFVNKLLRARHQGQNAYKEVIESEQRKRGSVFVESALRMMPIYDEKRKRYVSFDRYTNEMVKDANIGGDFGADPIKTTVDLYFGNRKPDDVQALFGL